MITFKAQLIDSTNITRVIGNNKTKDHKVSFIELKAKDKKDLETIRKVASSWDRYSYAGNIYGHALSAHLWEDDTDQVFFALTEQRTGFQKADPLEILGLCEIRKRPGTNHYISYIQTDPEYKFEPLRFENAKYKHIGISLIKSLMKLFPQKDFVLHATHSSIDFYEKIGGKIINPDTKYILLKAGLFNKVI